MNSLSRRYRSVRPDAGEFLPPQPAAFDAIPFGDPQRTRLTGWLREAAWPREHMEVAELEGYLVALIAWPVGIPSGAWLPPIWGERGWKVPTKISSRQEYDEFAGLVFGFMRTIECDLSRRPSRFESSVLRLPRGSRQVEALHCWGRGFMTALTLGVQGLKGRSASATDAVRTIANVTSASAPLDPLAVEQVVSAAVSLMEQRTSRGPLGPLITVLPGGLATEPS
jgi:yecA family protein